MDIAEFFPPPPTITFAPDAPAVLACKRCPVRVQCIRHAYKLGLNGSGYFGGMTTNERKEHSLEEALVYISTGTFPGDPPPSISNRDSDGDSISETDAFDDLVQAVLAE